MQTEATKSKEAPAGMSPNNFVGNGEQDGAVEPARHPAQGPSNQPASQGDEARSLQAREAEVNRIFDTRFANALARAQDGFITKFTFEKIQRQIWLERNLHLQGIKVQSQGFECSVCLEYTGTSSEEAVTFECGHYFCINCARNHIESCYDDGRQISCLSCSYKPSPQIILEVTAGCGRLHDKLQTAELMRHFSGNVVYCRNERCAEAFIRDNISTSASSSNGLSVCVPAECPLCKTSMCASCGGSLHPESCEEAKEAEEENAKLLIGLASQEKWTKCPKCRMLIDKTKDSCNFVSCRCGTRFCYRCGKPYESAKPTANNLHGTAKCKCRLFTYE